MEGNPRVDSSLGDYLVELRGIVKQFPGVLANDHVDFQLRRGEIHALLGENGAGKTTLMNVLYGIIKPDSGESYVKGRKVHIRSPKDAIALGIGMVHQHMKVVEPHTVVENVILGLKEPRFLLDLKEAASKVKQISERYGLKVDPFARIWQLSVGEKQRVEILKVLYRGADILIMDEPTSVLTPQETHELFSSLKTMAAEGKGVVYITHKLKEVFELSDRVTVMRKGKVVITRGTEGADERELAKLMVGREIFFHPERTARPPGKEMLVIEGLNAINDKGLPALKDVSLVVREGQILGIAGVAGNGQKELAEIIAGMRKCTSGRVSIGGADVTNKPSKFVFEKGLAYIPEERIGVGAVPTLNVAENLAVKSYRYRPFSNRGLLNREKMAASASELVKRFDIAAPSVETPALFLSGGNIQKVVLARELSGVTATEPPKVVMASYPTRGLDVGATEYVQKVLLQYRNEGCAIVIISEELDELLALSDELAVMFEGRIMGVLDRDRFDPESIGLMMAGRAAEVKGG
jgi:ABC-type uncharacterized transport system ATPase subunit